jgi:hypothetical protein
MGLKEDILARADLIDAVGRRDLDEIAAGISIGRTKRVLVPIADIQAKLMANGEWWRIKQAASQGNASAVIVVDMAAARFANVDYSLPLVGEQWDALVADGLIAQSTRDELQKLSVAPDPVDRLEVEGALFNPDGTMK